MSRQRHRDVAPDIEVEAEGHRLLTAVEQIVGDSGHLVAEVENFRSEIHREGGDDLDMDIYREAVADRIIRAYSTRSSISGGATAVPAMLPGLGTLVGVVGGSLVDMVMMLKYEVEMALCLTHLYGHDIRTEEGRWLAYALAAVNTYDAKSGRSYLEDVAEAQFEALAKYTPRQLTKLVTTVMGKIALLAISKNLVRALPLVGVVVGASANKILTTSVGWRCVEALSRRGPREEDPVVEVKIR